MKSLCLILVVVALAAARPQDPLGDYHGAQVLRIDVDSLSAFRYLNWLYTNSLHDFWTQPRKVGPVDIMARRWDLPQLKRDLDRRGFKYEVQIPNVGKHLSDVHERSLKARATSTAMDWDSYHTYDEINAWVDQLAVDYPDIATVTDVGTSYEGRTIKLLKLSTGGEGKDAIFSDGTIHAREWISPAVVTYIINQLVTDDSTGILDGVDLYFMPIINPDGYSYSWTNDRMWRKTRSINANSACFGVDANRNWDFHWAESGASDLPCSYAYHGTEPFSEVEMQIVRDILLDLVPRVYLSFHSYSEMWMWPYGYDVVYADNYEDLNSLGGAAVEALNAVYGTPYQVGNSAELLGAASGASDDYALGVVGSEYSYTIELRDRGLYGFDLPEDQIFESGVETYEAFKVVAQFIIDNPARK